VDYVIEGEGEYAAVELVEALGAGQRRPEIRNLLYRADGAVARFGLRPRFEGFDKLPHPDKELFFRAAPYLRELGYIAITSRGCPYQCTYCNSPSMTRLYPGTKPVWRRPVESLIDELEAARRRYRIPYVWFADDTFVMGNAFGQYLIAKQKYWAYGITPILYTLGTIAGTGPARRAWSGDRRCHTGDRQPPLQVALRGCIPGRAESPPRPRGGRTSHRRDRSVQSKSFRITARWCWLLHRMGRRLKTCWDSLRIFQTGLSNLASKITLHFRQPEDTVLHWLVGWSNWNPAANTPSYLS